MDLAPTSHRSQDLLERLGGGGPRTDLRFDYPVPKICFSHIHKTGGGTVKRVLEQFYAGDELDGSDREKPPTDNEFTTRVRDKDARGIRFLSAHRDHSTSVGPDWLKVVFTRNPKSRLRSSLNSALGERLLSLSPSPELDRAAMLKGGLPQIVERDDEFAIRVGKNSLNLLARSFLQGLSRRDIGNKAYVREFYKEHEAYLDSLGMDEVRSRVAAHLDTFDFAGCLESFDLSVAMLMWRLGLPAQRTIASVHQKKSSVKELAEQVVDSIPAADLDRLIGKDRVVDSLLRARFERERETFRAMLAENGADEGGVQDFVEKAFERSFGEHIAGRSEEALSEFKLEPGDAMLGWGLGVHWAPPGAGRAAFVLDEGASCGFYVHLRPHEAGRISLLCHAQPLRRRTKTGFTATLDGIPCEASEPAPAPEMGPWLAWVHLSYRIDARPSSGMHRIEIHNPVANGAAGRIHAIVGSIEAS